ncbi:MAG: FG-GAP-like repeat-containing protein, partial [Methylacidiphilales bacterium]|nr:FG-GAP-like repeat-containing protein [Candidatus Methylacidiphilales bacterium]
IYSGYIAGREIKTTKRLKLISCYCDQKLIKEYQLKYDMCPTTIQSRIKSIQEVAGNGQAFRPLLFEYLKDGINITQPSNAWTLQNSYNLPYPVVKKRLFYGKEKAIPTGAQFVDLNADGLFDYVYYYVHKQSGVIEKGAYINTGSGWRKDQKYDPPIPISDEFSTNRAQFIDIDADGFLEIVELPTYESLRDRVVVGNFYRGWRGVYNACEDYFEYHNTFDSSTSSRSSNKIYEEYLTYDSGPYVSESNTHKGGCHQTYKNDWNYVLVEVKAKGQSEINSFAGKVYKHDGTSWKEFSSFRLPISIGGPDGFGWLGLQFAELNGDGLPDIVQNYKNQVKSAWINTGSGWIISESFTPPMAIYQDDDTNSDVLIQDINGDGLSDVISAKEIEVTEPVSVVNKRLVLGKTIDIHSSEHKESTAHGECFASNSKYWRRTMIDLKDVSLSYPQKFLKTDSQVYLNTGTGYQISNEYKLPCPLVPFDKNQDTGTRITDLNGDGLPDIIQKRFLKTKKGILKPVVNKAYFFTRRTSCQKQGNATWWDGKSWQVRKRLGLNPNSTMASYQGQLYQDMLWHDNTGWQLGDLVYEWVEEIVDEEHNFVYLNTGKGWTKGPESLKLPWYTAYHDHGTSHHHKMGLALVDINGDRLQDIVVNRWVNPTITHSAAWLNRGGRSWEYVPAFIPHHHIEGDGADDVGTRIVDINGDGLNDILWHREVIGSNTQIVTSINRAKGPLLSSVTNGYGYKIKINFGHMSDPNLYTKDVGVNAAVYPIIDVYGSTPLLESIEKEDGVGGFVKTSYKYTGMKVHALGREQLGFRCIEEKDHLTGVTIRSIYHQEFPLDGVIKEIETRSSEGILLSTTKNTWKYKIYDGIENTKYFFPYLETGIESTYEYNTGQLVSSVTTTSNYDDFGNLIESVITDNQGKTKISKNLYNNFTSNGKWILGRLYQSSVVHKSSGLPDIVRTSSFSYNPNTGILASETISPNQPDSVTTTYEHDGFGNVLSNTVTANGVQTRVTINKYDSKGRDISSATSPLGHKETIKTNHLGTPHEITGPNSITTTYEYDGMARKIKETRADNTVTTISYQWAQGMADSPIHASYAIITSTTGLSPVTVFYDRLGRELRAVTLSPDGRKIYVDKIYDSKGRLHKASEPYFLGSAPLYSTHIYDILDRPIEHIRPDGARSKIFYGTLSTTTIDSENRKQIHTFDREGRITSVTDNAGQTTHYKYDAVGNLIQTIAADGTVTDIQYDPTGRFKISMKDPNMGTWYYKYNALGELIEQVDAKGQKVSMKYDLQGRLIERKEPEGTTIWTYDTAQGRGIGKLASVSGPNGYLETYIYDNLGRLQSTTTTAFGVSYTHVTEYDSLSRPYIITYPSGLQIQNHYNSHGALHKISSPNNNTIYWQAIEWDARGNLVKEQLGNGLITSRSYRPENGFLQSIHTQSGAVKVQDLSYQFTPSGNLALRTDHRINKTETFQYDNLARLVTASVNGLPAESFTYDAVGNLKSKTYVGAYQYNNPSAPHRISSITLGTQTRTFQYDANGNLINDEIRTYQYASHNKPILITKGIPSLGGVTI